MIRKTRNGMERKTQEVHRIASLGDEMKMTKADLDWDESLQDELAMEAGAEPEEMVLMKDVLPRRSLRLREKAKKVKDT